mmetsp:Transcript_20944/g.31966  ORF Transcript_20944/g.31966 Transcript_20944/m.31966 type:complete len:85 (-) Transcript_20944:400-654(-)
MMEPLERRNFLIQNYIMLPTSCEHGGWLQSSSAESVWSTLLCLARKDDFSGENKGRMLQVPGILSQEKWCYLYNSVKGFERFMG